MGYNLFKKTQLVKMKQHIAQVTLLVANYDEAITFYTQKLGFSVIEDTPLSSTKRWVVVAPPFNAGCNLLFAEAANPDQQSRVGNQTGGRVFLFLYTDHFEEYYRQLLLNEVKIIREPSIEVYGTVAVFADLYGNLWDLIEPGEK
jgi:catechol 2,3-dioxygenase-like lactoylglutathione lyase family enzyme